MLVATTISPQSAGALVQRLLGTRNLPDAGLLGLPMAQQAGAVDPAASRANCRRLLASMERERGLEANRALLDRLTALATELRPASKPVPLRRDARLSRTGAGAARGRSARRAWRIIRISSFLDRRLSPAIRTCATVEQSQANLSSKIARIAELLRTRVDVELESQNADQMRRWRIACASSYACSRRSKACRSPRSPITCRACCIWCSRGAHEAGAPFNPALATGAAVPVVFATVAFVVWRIRHRHEE